MLAMCYHFAKKRLPCVLALYHTVRLMPHTTPQALEAAIQRGAENYFAACRSRVEGFSDGHFRFPGAWQTNRIALGWDLLRAPLNLMWAPIYLLLQILAWTCQRMGMATLAQLLDKAPSGLTTDVQRQLAAWCNSELLQRPNQPGQPEPLLAYIVEEVDSSLHLAIDSKAMLRTLQPTLDDILEQYALSRTATADIGNSLSTTLLGAFAFQKFTPGGVAVGLLLASISAREVAVHNFPLGQTIGKLWYGWFPPEPSLATSVGVTSLVLLLLASLASLSGLLSDPLQSTLGLHQRRLYKMIDHLERNFSSQSQSRFRSGEHYLARLLDVVDAARSQWL
jgi:hypothetical protein